MAASPSAFSLPSTPSHQSATSPSPSTSTSRHLKRLSLGGTAFSPSSSPSSPNSPRSTNQATPTSASRGHGNRALRLSMSGGGLGYTRESNSSPASAPPTGESPTASRSTLTNGWSSPLEGGSTSTAPTTPGAGASSAGIPSGSRSLGRGASGGGGGHSRRMSSISYASSSREAGESPGGGLASPSAQAQAQRTRLNLGVASPSLGRSVSPIGELGGEEEERSRSVTPNAGVREGEMEQRGSPLLGRAGGSSNLSRREGGAGAGNQPTLTEANADLLSFIAKKERKCLDLREELKRHESELQQLKKKWEAIVAKSLHSNSPPTTTSMPRLSSPDMKRSSASSSSTSTTSPHTSPTPRPHAPLHTLDLSLLSSTFDPTSSHDGAEQQELELPESVQAATKWMGGMFGKVLDAVGAVEEAMSPVYERGEEERGLGSLVEEEEPEEQVEGSPRVGGSETRRQERRASKASSSSASIDSSSSFGFGFLGGGGGGGGGGESARTSTSTQPEEEDEGPTPTPSSPSSAPLPLSPDLSHRRHALTSPPPPSSLPRSSSQSHARSRSTFDVLSNVTSGGWSSLGKKWTAVTESETFRNGRKTTYGLLDTFEQGLATALGPLDPPPLSPIADEFGALSPNPSSSHADDRRAEGEVRTPKQGDDWDWSAFHDGDDPSSSSSSAAAPKIGGYRRPSLTPNKHGGSSSSTITTAKSPRSPASAAKALAPSPSTSAQAQKRLSGERKPAGAEKATTPAPLEHPLQQQQAEEKPALPSKEDGHVSDSWATW